MDGRIGCAIPTLAPDLVAHERKSCTGESCVVGKQVSVSTETVGRSTKSLGFVYRRASMHPQGAPARNPGWRWALIFFASTLGAASCAAPPPARLPGSARHPLLGTTPKMRSEPSLGGELVTLPSAGHVTLVDFWSLSCEPCVAMMPAIEETYRKKRSAGLVVVGIASDDNPGLVRQRLVELGVSYPNVVDSEGPVRGAFRVDSLPQTVVFDRHGVVRLVRIGGSPADVSAVREAVDLLLGQAK